MIFKAIGDTVFDSKPVIVLDEFQYIGKASPAFPSVFQRIWEETLKNKSVMVILCGSLIPMMESQTLSYNSPLYGRRTAQIRLGQIPFRHYHDFFPNKNRRELIEMYSITGGVPKYIELFSESSDIYKSIEECVLNCSGYLYDEPHFLLQQEVSEIGSYFSIIRTIAAGNSKLSAISAVLEIKATSLAKYLKTLINLDILEREIPITEGNPEKSKRGLYKIKDKYIRFWFAFVYEEVCRERMWDLNASGCWPFHFSNIGRWWDGKNEIDIAAIDLEGNNLILGECKYWHEPVGVNILLELERKTDSVDWRKKDRHVWYVLFGAAGFAEELKALAAARTAKRQLR